jgi:hypothetical protein
MYTKISSCNSAFLVLVVLEEIVLEIPWCRILAPALVGWRAIGGGR